MYKKVGLISSYKHEGLEKTQNDVMERKFLSVFYNALGRGFLGSLFSSIGTS